MGKHCRLGAGYGIFYSGPGTTKQLVCRPDVYHPLIISGVSIILILIAAYYFLLKVGLAKPKSDKTRYKNMVYGGLLGLVAFLLFFYSVVEEDMLLLTYASVPAILLGLYVVLFNLLKTK